MKQWTELLQSKKLKELIDKCEKDLHHIFKEIENIAENNQFKVLQGFQKNKISEGHLWGSTGYGYGDLGREGLDNVYASIFNTEAALVRQQFVSGTHCISACLFALLKRGDKLLYVTGKPYDTLEKTIGIVEHPQSLIAKGVEYSHVNFLPNGEIDYQGIKREITPNTKVVAIQRSKGYSLNKSITIKEMAEIIQMVKGINPEIIIFVDNCYGEFTEELEPTDVGADIITGSLIKNPGGGLAYTGGYVVGKEELIQRVAEQLTAPGLGKEVGATLNVNLPFYQGLFIAPRVVADSLKVSVLTAYLAEGLGFDVHPKFDVKRTDIVQAIIFYNKEKLIKFCQEIQHNSPIDSYSTPIPDQLPGYQNPVIMAAGTFIQGASIELSADAPIKEPYIGYVQGSLTYQHGKIAIARAFDNVLGI
ncbi:Cystathionine beta-lyase family protein involved in aluminum resistance [Anaerobranca californiensis DSM 14826]|uniref:Cystathionine beta-lyase family protein involved in aluminum resistance n=1 Tax=Anaerobranca californiensis DSM 14826 TaxID=1120989 RepID=A0A1M6K987_9FIRM|nr:methionine gamma-lyase family protein [Anaerobranca californiensis]SHJ55474.1 Cystathionine beta-lyase family protein involved in aluminum resistance [Anaerobranca californiensis DSM 14826]